MPTPSDKSNARELTRMVTSYADGVDLGLWLKIGKWGDYREGRAAMSLPVLCAVARVLGISVGQLISKAEARHRG